tara:strand:- start:2522 stop:5407 length:2886 start_codon:yes stop_codon:yes gene_type:complete
MVLISVQSVETNNGYQFKNDFSESIIIDPKSKISLVSILFERSADFVVQSTSNMFRVRIGAPNTPLDTISIAEGTYTGSTLATEIEQALNNKYSAVGHVWDVKYDTKNQEFSFHDNFQQQTIDLKKTDSYTTDNGSQLIISGSGDINFGNITNGTSNYAISRDRIETNFTPASIYGGSSVDFSISFTATDYPVLPGADTFGFLMGLTSGSRGTPTQQASPISNAGNYDWLDCGLVYYKATGGGATNIKIIEEGVAIGDPFSHAVRSGDKFKVMIATDDITQQNYPTYWYKRVNDTEYTKFSTSGSTQSFSYAKWHRLKLSPVCGADSRSAQANQPTGFMELTPSGVNNVLPRAPITAGLNGLRIGATQTLIDNTLRRKLNGTDGGTNTNQLTLNDGALISSKVGADVYSEFSFKLFDKAFSTAGTADPIDFYVAVVDEELRVLNRDNVGTNTAMGTADPIYGNVSSDGFTAIPAPNMNPSLLAFRFKGQARTGSSEDVLYPPNKIYYRDSFNANNDFVSNSIVQAPWAEVPNFVWNPTTQKDALFLIKTYATSGFSEIWVSVGGDKKDATLITKIRHNRVNTTGIQVATLDDGGNGYDVTSTLQFRATDAGSGERVNAIFEATTDGGGAIAGAITVLCAGDGFTIGDVLALVEIDADGNDTASSGTGAQVAVGAVVGYNNTGNRGCAYDASKVEQGYSYYASVGSYDPTRTTEQQGVQQINLAVENAFNVQQEYAEIHPRVETGFGDIIGMGKSRYILDKATGWSASSDTHPKPDGSTSTHPILHVYADNLPIKSYVGKRYQRNATINDNPIGNQQGLTNLLAQVPRHHDDNGEAGSANTGPYYFDYFPYSIPLHNATQLLRNELDISIRNPDGTLATDITRSLLLLDVSNVDNVGEGLTGGNIGDPRIRQQSSVQLDIGKNQLQPTIGGGKQQSSVSRHEDSDVNNTAIASGKDKSATLF